MGDGCAESSAMGGQTLWEACRVAVQRQEAGSVAGKDQIGAATENQANKELLEVLGHGDPCFLSRGVAWEIVAMRQEN